MHICALHFYTKNTTFLVTDLFWGISKALVEHKGQNSEYHKTVNTDKVFSLKVTERRNIKWNLSQFY